MGEILAFLSAIGYTSQLILIKKGCRDKSFSGPIPIQLFVISSAISIIFAIYLIEILVIKNSTIYSHFLSVPKTAIIYIVLDGLLGPFGGLFLLTKATEYIGPSKTSVLRASNPIFAAIFAAIILKEKPGIMGILAIILLVIGLYTVIWNKGVDNVYIMKNRGEERLQINDKEEFYKLTMLQKETGKVKIDNTFKGKAYALLSGGMIAIAQTARGAALAQGATPKATVFWGTTVSFVALLLVYYVDKRSIDFRIGIDKNSYKYYIYAGGGFVIGASALAASFVHIDVWKAVAIRNLQPVISLLMSWLFLRQQEKINLRLISGAILVVIAIWIISIF